MKYMMIHHASLDDCDNTVESYVSSLCNTPEECIDELKRYNLNLNEYVVLQVSGKHRIANKPVVGPLLKFK